MKSKLPVICLIVLFCAAFGRGQEQRVKVRATGQAPADLANARYAAVDEALRQAVEAGAGVTLASESEVFNYELVRDAIYTQSAGLVEKYDVIKENPNQDGFYTVQVEAIVSRTEIDTRLQAWKTLLRQKGYPRMMVVGSVDKRPFDYRLTAELQGMMEKRNMKVVDLGMLSENQRRDAELAAKGELDPAKAAMIVREDVDYFVVVQVSGFESEPAIFHGVQMFTVNTTAVLKVIAVDTSEIIASEVVDLAHRDIDKEKAIIQSGSKVVARAMENAMVRIADNWLSQFDRNNGAQIEVVLNKFPFEHMEGLMHKLQQAAVGEIAVDFTNSQGRTQWTVTTKNNSVNLASVLKKLDPTIEITSSTKNRIVIDLKFNSPKSFSISENKGLVVYAVGGIGGIIIIWGIILLLKK